MRPSLSCPQAAVRHGLARCGRDSLSYDHIERTGHTEHAALGKTIGSPLPSPSSSFFATAVRVHQCHEGPARRVTFSPFRCYVSQFRMNDLEMERTKLAEESRKPQARSSHGYGRGRLQTLCGVELCLPLSTHGSTGPNCRIRVDGGDDVDRRPKREHSQHSPKCFSSIQ